MEHIHIAIAANSNYIVPSTVLLQSIFEHNKENDICIYLLYLEGSLSEAETAGIARFTEGRGGRFRPLCIRPEQLADFPETRHGKAALLRLCLPAMLPEVDKILYLDGDIVVKDSLAELYATDLGDHYIAAGKDTCPVYHPERMPLLGIDREHWYFNSGVVLMNLKAFRGIDLPAIVSRYAAAHYNFIESPDQDALNFICAKRTVYLHPRYNMNYAVEKDVADETWGADEVKAAKRNPAVIHYIGPVKPWSVRCTHPRRKDWWDCLERTPYAGYRAADDTAANRISTCMRIPLKAIENRFTLSGKRKLGKMLPGTLTRWVKKCLGK